MVIKNLAKKEDVWKNNHLFHFYMREFLVQVWCVESSMAKTSGLLSILSALKMPRIVLLLFIKIHVV